MPISSTFAKYRVLRPLGRGGMGEVHLAEDVELGRKVALKFLSASLLRDQGARRRFLHESRAAAALDHPFICKIYEAGEADGTPFIAMEYVEGMTLRERLAHGPMALAEAVRVAGEIAEALEEAHRRGIIHRDLKPSNIFLAAQGHVKILDFGLAKRLPSPERLTKESTTSAGVPPGTPAYMSPEQLNEERPGPGSDIFSFGIVLYQMLTGVHPFLRKSTADTMHAILYDAEPPLARYREDVPELLRHTVGKMLAKDPAFRYQSVHEVRTDLAQSLPRATPASASEASRVPLRRGIPRWALALSAALALAVLAVGIVFWPDGREEPVVPPVAEESVPSIAVLPFADMSPGKSLEYFCDGIAEQIISELSAIERLRVTARTSAFAFKRKGRDVREIGRTLGVDHLLEGSVRQVDDRLRITVQLVNAEDGFHAWSRDYDRDLTDVLDVQEEIAREVVGSLETGLVGASVLGPPPTASPEAYLLYLKGRFFWNRRTPASLERAVRMFEQALEHDPGYALAYTGMADAYNLMEVYSGISPAEATAKASAAVSRALELDDTLAEAHASMGILLERQWDWKGAEREYRRALEIKPGDATTRCWYAQLAAQTGRHDDALREIQRAARSDPLSAYVNTVHGTILYVARRYEDAVRQLEFTLELAPDYHGAHAALAYVRAAQGMPEQAVESARRAAQLAGDAETSAVLAYALAVAGRTDEAEAIVARLVDLWEQGRGSPGRIAVVYTGLDVPARAFEWLERTCRERDIWATQLKVDPLFDELRSDPRFAGLLAKVRLAD